MSALERLHAKKVITLEEAQTAARLITGEPNTIFPPPARPPGRAAPADTPAAESSKPPTATPTDAPQA